MIIEKTKLVVLLTEKNLIGLALANGKLQWQVAAPSQQRYFNASSPYIDGQTIIYTGLGTGIKAIKVSKQGEKFITEDLWSNINTGAKWNTPILKNGFIYGFTDQKRIYCINASNGETAWIDKAVTSDFGTIVDCGLVIIGLASTNSLIVLKPDGREYSELAKYKVAETPIYAYPIICGNNIYIKDSESLILYNLK
jgi:outer membrane protein assembly factor BamB